MSYPIDVTVPNAPNNPADDQPIMKTNFANIRSYLNVDHVLAGALGDGFHEQVTYYTKNTPLAPTDPASIAFTAQASTLTSANVTGSASNIAQNFFRNQNGIYPLMPLKAFAKFSTVAVPVILNGMNVSTIVRTGGPTFVFTVTLVSNTLSGINYSVFAIIDGVTTGAVLPVTIISSNSFSVQISSGSPTTIRFFVLEI